MIDPGFLKWILFIYFILQIALADCNHLVQWLARVLQTVAGKAVIINNIRNLNFVLLKQRRKNIQKQILKKITKVSWIVTSTSLSQTFVRWFEFSKTPLESKILKDKAPTSHDECSWCIACSHLTRVNQAWTVSLHKSNLKFFPSGGVFLSKYTRRI